MKIDKIAEIAGGLKQPETARTAKGGDDFSRLLNEEMDLPQSGAVPIAGGMEPMFFDASLRIQPMDISSYPPVEVGQVETDVNSAMEKLEKIGQQLGDSSVSPRDIDEALGTLKLESMELARKAENLPPNHPLRKIAEDLSVLTNVESIKWRRGDYL